MKFEINDTLYTLVFKRYFLPVNKAFGEERVKQLKRRLPSLNSSTNTCITHAMLFVGEGKEKQLALLGLAMQSPEDRFSKDKGRRVALTYMLNGTDRIVRCVIWDVYNSVTRGIKTELKYHILPEIPLPSPLSLLTPVTSNVETNGS